MNSRDTHTRNSARVQSVLTLNHLLETSTVHKEYPIQYNMELYLTFGSFWGLNFQFSLFRYLTLDHFFLVSYGISSILDLGTGKLSPLQLPSIQELQLDRDEKPNHREPIFKNNNLYIFA